MSKWGKAATFTLRGEPSDRVLATVTAVPLVGPKSGLTSFKGIGKAQTVVGVQVVSATGDEDAQADLLAAVKQHYVGKTYAVWQSKD